MQTNTPERRARLGQIMNAYGIELAPAEIERMLTHVDLVVEKNQVVNLTRIVEPDEALVRHVVDSLLFLVPMDAQGYARAARVLDIGTGAGFPGIPLALATGLRVTMIDSVGKKVAAVGEFVEKLGIADLTRAEQARAEVFARAHAHQFEFVVARAVAPLAVLVEYAAPFLTKSGLAIFSKAAIAEEEWGSGSAAAELCGLELVSRETFTLPDSQGTRELVTFRRARAPKVKLPRADGMARKRPLG